ncbi:MAG TPA: ABC transporter permease [Rhizobiales bacterium]|nr:ABC transporter permease [Hyphomicrobiales bacterium]
MNLAYRDVRHNVGRFLLASVGLSLLMAVVLSMMGIYNGIVVDSLAIVRAPQADVWIVESGTRGPFAEASRIPGDTREAIARLSGVSVAGSVTYQTVESEHRGGKIRLFVIGYELNRPGGPAHIVAGRSIGRSHYELVADRRSGLKLGDRVRLGRNVFNVVGYIENQVNFAGEPAVYITLLDAQKLQFELAPPAARVQVARGAVPEGLDTVNAVIARVLPTVSPETVAEAARRWKHLSATSQGEQENILTRSVVDKVRRQIGLFMVLLLVVSAVIIALIIYQMTMEKLRQIATLKLIGAPDRTIIALIVQQALALGMIGWALGFVLVMNVKDYFPRRVVLEPINILVFGCIIFVVCLLSSALGVRAALRVDPATALGN